MKRTPRYRYSLFVFSIAALAALVCENSIAQTGSGWKGTADSSFQNASNWDNGFGSNFNLFFGNAWVTAGSTGATTINNNSTYSGYRLTFEANAGTPTFTLQGSTITLFDFGGAVPKIENFSSVNQNVNTGITFGSGDHGEINAVSGTLTLGGTVTATAVNGIRLYGSSQIVNFNGTVNATGKYIGISTSGTGNTININGTTTAANFSVMNNGALNLNSGGTLNADVRLGIDYTGSGNVNNTQGASFNLTATAGGQTFAGVINSGGGTNVTGAANTSGALAVNSQNTSNTNILSGHIALDSNLTISQASGGTLSITQGRSTASGTTAGTDIKAQTLTFNTTGTGAINVGPASPTGFGTIYNGSGSGIVIKTGTGSLSLNDKNTFSGGLQIKAGTVFIGANDALGGTSGAGAVLLGDTTGTAAANLLTTGAFTTQNPITIQTGNSGLMTLGGNTAAASIFTGTVTFGTSGANPTKDATFVALAGGSVDFQGVLNENTSNTTVANVTIGDATHSGTVKFSGTNNGYGGSTTITNAATLEVVDLTSSNSSIGNSSSSTASNLVLSGGTLKYTGAGETTARSFTFDANGGALDASAAANAALIFSGGTAVASGTGNRTLTLSGTSTGPNALASAIADPSSGATSLTKSGAGSWTLTGNNTYTGATLISGGTLAASGTSTNRALGGTSGVTINKGGTLLMGANNQFNAVTPAGVTLGGGTGSNPILNAGGFSQGSSGTVGIGALTLNSNATIDLTGTSLLHFDTSTTATGGTILSILNWSGTIDTGGGAEELKFGSSNSDLSYISQIQFIDPVGYSAGTYAATFATLNPGEVVPVPEPSTWVAGGLAFAALAFTQRRRISRLVRRS